MEQQPADVPSGCFWAVYKPARHAGSQPWMGWKRSFICETKFAGLSSTPTAKSSFGADSKIEHNVPIPGFVCMLCVSPTKINSAPKKSGLVRKGDVPVQIHSKYNLVTLERSK